MLWSEKQAALSTLYAHAIMYLPDEPAEAASSMQSVDYFGTVNTPQLPPAEPATSLP